MGCYLSPLQLLVEFPELPWIPFGQGSPSDLRSMNAAVQDVGEQRACRQVLSLEQKQHILESYEKSGKHIDEFMKEYHEAAAAQGLAYHVTKDALLEWAYKEIEHTSKHRWDNWDEAREDDI